MGQQQRLSRCTRPDIVQSRSVDSRRSRGTEERNHGGERLTRAPTSTRTACTGGPRPKQGLDRTYGTSGAQLSSVGPSVLRRWECQDDVGEAWNPLAHTTSSHRPFDDLTAIAEKLQHVPLTEPDYHQRGVVKAGRGSGGNRAETGSSTKAGPHGSTATGSGKPKKASYADAVRGSDTPLIKTGRATISKDGHSCFACFRCKYRLLEARIAGSRNTDSAPLCQLVVGERSVRRYSVKRHIPSNGYCWNDCGAISDAKYNKVDDYGEYIQRARTLANVQGVRGREREEFLWRTCFVSLYPAYESIKHLLNPYGYEDSPVCLARLRTSSRSSVDDNLDALAASASAELVTSFRRYDHEFPHPQPLCEDHDTPISRAPPITTGFANRVTDHAIARRHHPNMQHTGATPTYARVVAAGPVSHHAPRQTASNATTSKWHASDNGQYTSSTQEDGLISPLQANPPTTRQLAHPQPESRSAFNRSRSNTTRKRPTVPPALPFASDDPNTPHEEARPYAIALEEHRPPAMTEPQAGPTYTQLLSMDLQDIPTLASLGRYASQFVSNTEHTGLTLSMSQHLATPTLNSSTNTGHSFWVPPPTPTGQGWDSSAAIVGPTEVLTGLRLASQQNAQAALSNITEDMESLPEWEKIYKQFVNDSPSPPSGQGRGP